MLKLIQPCTGCTAESVQGAPAISSLMLQNWIPDEVVSELIRRGNQAETTDGGIGGSAMLYNNPETEMMYGAGSAVRSVD